IRRIRVAAVGETVAIEGAAVLVFLHVDIFSREPAGKLQSVDDLQLARRISTEGSLLRQVTVQLGLDDRVKDPAIGRELKEGIRIAETQLAIGQVGGVPGQQEVGGKDRVGKSTPVAGRVLCGVAPVQAGGEG